MCLTDQELLVDLFALRIPNLQQIFVVILMVKVRMECFDVIFNLRAHSEKYRAVLHPLMVVASSLQGVQLYII
jgi:hypothetical protein